MGEREHSAPGQGESGRLSSAPFAPTATEQPDIVAIFPLIQQGKQLLAADASAAEAKARVWLLEHPADPDASYLLGAAWRRLGRSAEACTLLESLTQSQPQMPQAWRELGLVRAQLGEQQGAAEALRRAIDLDWFDAEAWLAFGETASHSDPEGRGLLSSVAHHFAQGGYAAAPAMIDRLVAMDPADGFLRVLKGLALAWSRHFEDGVEELARATREFACGPGAWLEFAKLLRATGDDRAADAFAGAISLLPSFAEAYVGLANSKSIRIDEYLLDLIRARLARADLPANDRARLSYVLGRALEDLGHYAESFDAYRASNEILKRIRGSGVEHSNLYLRHAAAFFTKEFFVTRGAAGADTDSPIFIVGMPRSGSTLVEQILASHPQVEALGEIGNLTQTAQRMAPGRTGDPQGGYPWVLKYLDGAGFQRLGDEYLRSTLSQRRTDRPYFTDKLPGNFCHVGMIHLALPNSHIIDVRRHPLDCCLSCYKHFFPAGHIHALDLSDIGHFYANYVALMAHFDEVLPDRVYRLIYEDLVVNPEAEIRRMLDHIGLPFDETCLRFYENRRAVLTFSADQVRQPLFGAGVGRWRHYDAYLGQLRKALGNVVDAYPAVPKSALTHATLAPGQEMVRPRASFATGLRYVSVDPSSQYTVTPLVPGKTSQ